jgi:hypothetical protein
MDVKLLIHFAPGARGDFLSSVLKDNWRPREFGALNPPNYVKIHHINDQSVINNNYSNYIRIRINCNYNINNIMQIAYNHYLKNTIVLETSFLDQFFLFIKNFIMSDQSAEIDTTSYNYCIDFSLLSDLKFIEEFYLRIHNIPIDQEFLFLINDNIISQKLWTSETDLLKLSKLVDFEYRNRLFNWKRSFSLDDYLNSSQPDKFIQYQNYWSESSAKNEIE